MRAILKYGRTRSNIIKRWNVARKSSRSRNDRNVTDRKRPVKHVWTEKREPEPR